MAIGPELVQRKSRLRGSEILVRPNFGSLTLLVDLLLRSHFGWNL
jgi:hypothetical protein